MPGRRAAKVTTRCRCSPGGHLRLDSGARHDDERERSPSSGPQQGDCHGDGAQRKPDNPALTAQTFASYISEGDDPTDLLTGAMNLCTLLLIRLEVLTGRDPKEELSYIAARYGKVASRRSPHCTLGAD